MKLESVIYFDLLFCKYQDKEKKKLGPRGSVYLGVRFLY